MNVGHWDYLKFNICCAGFSDAPAKEHTPGVQLKFVVPVDGPGFLQARFCRNRPLVRPHFTDGKLFSFALSPKCPAAAWL
jgi:hypothetical protein